MREQKIQKYISDGVQLIGSYNFICKTLYVALPAKSKQRIYKKRRYCDRIMYGNPNLLLMERLKTRRQKMMYC